MWGMSSACSNPFLYGWLNENFRKEFKEILGACFGEHIKLSTPARASTMDESRAPVKKDSSRSRAVGVVTTALNGPDTRPNVEDVQRSQGDCEKVGTALVQDGNTAKVASVSADNPTTGSPV